MRCSRDSQNFFRLCYLIERSMRSMELEVRERRTQTCAAVVRLQRQSLVEVSDRSICVLKIVFDIGAIYECLDHFGIAFESASVIIDCFVEQSLLLVDMALQKREIRFLRQHDFVTAEVVERISKIHGAVEILRTLCQNLVTELCRFAILSFKEERPLPLALNARVIHHCRR